MTAIEVRELGVNALTRLGEGIGLNIDPSALQLGLMATQITLLTEIAAQLIHLNETTDGG